MWYEFNQFPFSGLQNFSIYNPFPPPLLLFQKMAFLSSWLYMSIHFPSLPKCILSAITPICSSPAFFFSLQWHPGLLHSHKVLSIILPPWDTTLPLPLQPLIFLGSVYAWCLHFNFHLILSFVHLINKVRLPKITNDQLVT